LPFILSRWHRCNKAAYLLIVLRVYLASMLIISNVLFVTMYSGNRSLVNHVRHLSVQNVFINGSPIIRISVLINANHTRSENVHHLLLNYLLNYKLLVSINQLIVNRSSLVNFILDILLLFPLIGRLVWSIRQTWSRMWLSISTMSWLSITNIEERFWWSYEKLRLSRINLRRLRTCVQKRWSCYKTYRKHLFERTTSTSERRIKEEHIRNTNAHSWIT
jgi:hypothetical protein